MALAQAVYEVSRFAGDLVVDTKMAYFESVAARDLLANAREGADVNRKSLAAVQASVRGGVATTVEANLAQSELQSAELAEILAMSSQRTSFSSGVIASHSSRRATNSGATSATRAPQSAKIRATRGSDRRGFGG